MKPCDWYPPEGVESSGKPFSYSVLAQLVDIYITDFEVVVLTPSTDMIPDDADVVAGSRRAGMQDHPDKTIAALVGTLAPFLFEMFCKVNRLILREVDVALIFFTESFTFKPPVWLDHKYFWWRVEHIFLVVVSLFITTRTCETFQL